MRASERGPAGMNRGFPPRGHFQDRRFATLCDESDHESTLSILQWHLRGILQVSQRVQRRPAETRYASLVLCPGRLPGHTLDSRRTRGSKQNSQTTLGVGRQNFPMLRLLNRRQKRQESLCVTFGNQRFYWKAAAANAETKKKQLLIV